MVVSASIFLCEDSVSIQVHAQKAANNSEAVVLEVELIKLSVFRLVQKSKKTMLPKTRLYRLSVQAIICSCSGGAKELMQTTEI